jgi:Xaa-Pro aminopeptidase
MSGQQADAVARKCINEAGYGNNFGHGLGHGLGLGIHEKPTLGPSSTDILRDGMAFTIEPGIYINGWGGVRIEDTVALDCAKIRTLSQADK